MAEVGKVGIVKGGDINETDTYLEFEGKWFFGKITDFRGKRIYKPSNRLLAQLYKSAQKDSQCWVYECKKCGWISDTYTP